MCLFMEICTTTQKINLPKTLKGNLINSLNCQIARNTKKENRAQDNGGMQSENPRMWETTEKIILTFNRKFQKT